MRGGGGRQETTKRVMRMSGLKWSQSGEVGMKQSRVDQQKKEREKQ